MVNCTKLVSSNMPAPIDQHLRVERDRVCQHLINVYGLLITVIFPTMICVIRQYLIKVPYHTSILSGEGWVQELLAGHPNCIQCELGVSKHVFKALIEELHEMGHSDSRKIVTLEEQLAIFLYTCVTGLTTRHVGERFQHSNETISR